MNLLPIIALILIYFFYRKRNRNRFGIVNLLILTYLVMGCASLILELSGKFRGVFPYTFEPMAYLSICFFITFWGFAGFRDYKLTKIKIENMYFYQALETFLLIGGLLAILFFLPFAYVALTGDVFLNRLTVVLAGSILKKFGLINSIFSLLANLFILNQLCSFINLIPRNGKRKVLKAYLFIISSLSYVVYIFAYVGRDGVVFWLMSYVFCYLLFQDFLVKSDVKKLRFLFTLSSVILLIPFMIITIARFSNLVGGVWWQILNYGGQQLCNFNDQYTILEPLAYGRSGFPVFVELIEFVTFFQIQVFDKDKMFSYFLNYGVIPWSFTTFIGTLMLDFGKIWTLVFLCLMSLTVRRILKTVSTKGVFEFSNIIVLTLLYQIVYWGVFYFKQYATNYYIIFLLILSGLFKLSNDIKLSVFFTKTGSTQMRRSGQRIWLNKILRQIVQK